MIPNGKLGEADLTQNAILHLQDIADAIFNFFFRSIDIRVHLYINHIGYWLTVSLNPIYISTPKLLNFGVLIMYCKSDP